MELLAPAGDFACLEAAIEAGADAVYLGLSLLNARRSARNFTPAELTKAVELAEKHRVATYLTLNIDITRRETGSAARLLSLAREAGVTAVIARDFAVVSIWRVMREASARSGCHCPALHLSTQASITNSQGLAIAALLGAKRVVLARELDLREIQQLHQESELEIEVFAQGALCYSISGRCLMSSWGGGRSGNRGLCASPCRAPWSVDGEPVGTAMSMRDLVTVDRLRELSLAGVDAIKIEGRLKKPAWVREAVELYRQALGPRHQVSELTTEKKTVEREQARRLAAYAGRDITSNYLDGNFQGLTGIAARKSGAIFNYAMEETETESKPVPRKERQDEGYRLELEVGDKGLYCRVFFGGVEEVWRLPRTRVVRENRAVRAEDLLESLRRQPLAGVSLKRGSCNQPDFLIPPRNVKSLQALLSGFLNRRHGPDTGEEALKAPLSEELRRVVKASGPHLANRRQLGELPNRIRLTPRQFNSSLLPLLKDVEPVLRDFGLDDLQLVARFVDLEKVCFAFPDVFFPADSQRLDDLADYLRQRQAKVEANCWGSLWLCRRHGLAFSAGPGLAVLNHLAATTLQELGATSVTVSLEADRRQIEDLSQAASTPLNLVVYARPVLAYTRILPAELLDDQPSPPAGKEGETPNRVWTDRRGIGLHPERWASITELRSVLPFTWAGLRNRRIRVTNLEMDLSAEASPLSAWRDFRHGDGGSFRFNYDRGLK
ncbi:MAG: U32 family peptidase [Planctomycetota bacterium]|jgi:collagenase-like PrtC family protease|nr:U32 family peptidase [Planctomycetota bacterium]